MDIKDCKVGQRVEMTGYSWLAGAVATVSSVDHSANIVSVEWDHLLGTYCVYVPQILALVPPPAAVTTTSVTYTLPSSTLSMLDNLKQLYSSVPSLSWYDFDGSFDQYNMRCNPEVLPETGAQPHHCADHRIDVGFTHHKFVCKICDQDLA